VSSCRDRREDQPVRLCGAPRWLEGTWYNGEPGRLSGFVLPSAGSQPERRERRRAAPSATSAVRGRRMPPPSVQSGGLTASLARVGRKRRRAKSTRACPDCWRSRMPAIPRPQT